jgi:hypothetical protein
MPLLSDSILGIFRCEREDIPLRAQSVHPAIAGVVPAVHGLAECAVHPSERERDERKQEEHDCAHPGERNERREDAAGMEAPAPVEVAPEVLCRHVSCAGT